MAERQRQDTLLWHLVNYTNTEAFFPLSDCREHGYLQGTRIARDTSQHKGESNRGDVSDTPTHECAYIKTILSSHC